MNIQDLSVTRIKRHSLPPLIVAAVILSMGGLTACHKYDGRKAAEDREKWLSSLDDSIRIITEENKENAEEIVRLRESVTAQLQQFTTVDNPREVEPYYIYTPFKGKYPLTSTGIAVRMLRNESLEVVAASSKPFSAIRVINGDKEYTTPVIPPDQALNYTACGLTTVSFSGAPADSISMVISSPGGENIVQFLNPRVTNTYKPTKEVRQLFDSTLNLYDTQRKLHRLERSISVNARKIEILKLTLQNENPK